MGRPRQVTLSVLAAIAVMAAGEASAVVPVSVRAPKEVAEALTISPGPSVKTSEILLRERFEGTWAQGAMDPVCRPRCAGCDVGQEPSPRLGRTAFGVVRSDR
jgi:hypothetical protein